MLTEALNSLVKDMDNEKQKLINDAEKQSGSLSEQHPLKRTKKALDEVLNKRGIK